MTDAPTQQITIISMANTGTTPIKKRHLDNFDAATVVSPSKKTKTLANHGSDPAPEDMGCADSIVPGPTEFSRRQAVELSTDNSLSSEEEGDDEISSSGYSSSSSSSSSSDETEEKDEGEDEDTDEEVKNEDGEPETETEEPISIPTIPTPLKPPIRLPNDTGLRSRLSAFLPAMKAANEDLERDIVAKNPRDVIMDNTEEEEGQYIEMVRHLHDPNRRPYDNVIYVFLTREAANIRNTTEPRPWSPRREVLKCIRL
jgi:hypothetical protein